MQFVLGYIAGLVTATLVLVALVFFKRQVESGIKAATQAIESVAPRPRGGVFLPDTEADIARKKLIASNNKKGVDTPFKDLR